MTLHHGSLLFDTNLENLVRALSVDDEKIVTKGLQSVRQRVTNIAEYLENKINILEFKDVMLKYLLKNMITYELTNKDIERVNEIKHAKFDLWEWNFGSDPKFNRTKEQRFAGGKICVQSYIEHGRLSNICFHGDFFAKEGLDELEIALRGSLFKEEEIKKVLEENNAENYFYNITLAELLSCIV